jgi:carbon-monoxide dehydrogenase small subunit
MSGRRPVRLRVNGEVRELAVEPRRLLVDALRADLGLTGTHAGCEHGVCGACTVLLDGRPIRACLMFAVQAAGHEIATVEGLARGERLHPLQEAFIEGFGFQCGFCTPGMLMAAHALLRENPEPSDAEIREAIGGNLCRCTGYADIVRSVRLAAAKLRAAGEA